MRTYLFEAAGNGNWGKFMVGIMDTEWQWRSNCADDDPRPILQQMGWGTQQIWVMDLATGEGALFRHGGYAKADLDKHRIWVCPLFEPFLQWLYAQDLRCLPELSGTVVQLPDVPFTTLGYRRSGPDILAMMLDTRPPLPRPPHLHRTAEQLRAELHAMDPDERERLIAEAEQAHQELIRNREQSPGHHE